MRKFLPLIASLILLIVIASCDESAPPTQTPVATSTATSVATSTATPVVSLDSVTAADWTNATHERRSEITHYYRDFWQKSTGEAAKKSELEMQVCITDLVIKPETKRTMLIMVLASKCLK